VCLLMVMSSAMMMAQKATVKGLIMDGGLNEPLPGAAVVLLNEKDSTQVTGVVSDKDGRVSMPVSKYGTYLLRISYMGYLTQYRTITLSKSKKEIDLGTVTLEEDAKVMKEAQVTAQLSQVEMKEDTFVYNAGAFRVPEGSNLEELIRKLPGAEVEDVMQNSSRKENLVNYVKDIYAPFSDEDISRKMVEMLRPDGITTPIEIVYQSLEGLHKACPNHSGDWYFSGNYPTPGGLRLLNRAFIDYYENVYKKI